MTTAWTNSSVTGRNIFYEGNSIINFNAASTVTNNYYTSTQVEIQLMAAGKYLLKNDYSKQGWRTYDLTADMPTTTIPRLTSNDIVVFWEIYNDLKVQGQTPAGAWTNVLALINLVKTKGAKLIILTAIAANKDTLRADYEVDRLAMNTIVRDNAVTYGYTVCDVAALTQFDVQADADNVTYYTDKTHLTQAGQDLIVTQIYNSIVAIY